MLDRGEPVTTTELALSHDVLVALPAVDLHSIGAGGGSIAWIDPVGALRVGPASAGSVPGPACYGRGGVEPTVTDAFVATGLLPEAAFHDTSFVLDPSLARRALEPLSERLAMSVEEAATAVLRVALANLVEAAREVSVYSGVDPRDFTLYVFGAAGPLFGSQLGRELGVRAVVVPPLAGTLSAYGLSISALRLDLSRPLVCGLRELSLVDLNEVYEGLEARGRAALGDKGLRFARWLDGRYRGQTWETPSVPVPAGRLDESSVDEIHAGFHATHERLWGYALPGFDVTAMMARITVFVDEGEERSEAPDEAAAERHGTVSTVRAFVSGEWLDVELRPLGTVLPGETVSGPVILLEETTTIVVMPGDTARLDELGHVWITWESADD